MITVYMRKKLLIITKYILFLFSWTFVDFNTLCTTIINFENVI
jgi:hypothetical protein